MPTPAIWRAGRSPRCAGYDYVVVPSGSCAGMLKTALSRAVRRGLARGRAGARARRADLRADQLPDRRPAASIGVDAEFPARVTYHDACAGLRELGIKQQPRLLLQSVRGLELTELPDAEVCCGFGGTFCVKYPAISTKMVDDKAADIVATGADLVLAGDLGCLMNIAGRLSRLGAPVEVAPRRRGPGRRPRRSRRSAAARPVARGMQATSLAFKDNARRALADPALQQALASPRAASRRSARVAAARLPEFEALRDQAKAIKDHTLAHLDLYLEAFEQRVIEQGGKVHWARDAAEARAVVLRLCKGAGARSVTKSKSMIAEEIGLNEALEASGIRRVETDLGEYIVQLAGETPSHILAPAIHMTKDRISAPVRRAPRHAARRGARGAARRGAARAAPALLRGRRRDHRRQFPDRRDRLGGPGHQRGQRRADPGPAQDPHRDRQPREAGADAGGRLHAAARAGPLGDRPGVRRLHHRADRAEAPGRPRRPERASTWSCSTTAAAA